MHLPWRDILPVPTATRAVNTSMTENEAADLVYLSRGKKVLEIGSANGFSACAMALGGAEHITAIDPHSWVPGSRAAMDENLREFGVEDKVTIIADTFYAAFAQLQEERYDFIFIDGDHTFNAIQFDVTNARKLLAPGGILACHDYGECCCPDVRPALDMMFPEGPTRLTDTLFIHVPEEPADA
jgi:protein-L-isoaspartate O-methyltransferase